MRVSPLLALLVVLPLAACDSGDAGSDDAVAVTATLVNRFERPLQGGTVTVVPRGASAVPSGAAGLRPDPVCTATTGPAGQFTCALPPGGYDVTVDVPGYSTDTFPITVNADGTVTLNLPPLTGQGNIDAQFVDAVSGAILTFAHVECRRQLPDGSYTEWEFEAETDAQGTITLEGVFLGQAECLVQAGASQIPVVLTITPTTDGTIPVTPPPPAGAYRVVLRWGASPSDLDAHLTGPDSTGAAERFHVYYGSRTYGPTNLDRDDTSSYGPETVTFFPTTDGVYRYTVHNYTLRGSTEGGQSIHDSPTTVELYAEDGLFRTYTAPPPTAQNDGTVANAWRVFELTKAGQSLTITGVASAPADQAQPGLAYVLADSPDDYRTSPAAGWGALSAK